MRHEPEQPDPPILDDHHVEDVFVPLDVERPRRVTPSLAKAIAYKRDRRFVGEDPHSSRKAWPRIKKIRRQIYRRKADRALRPALGTVTPDFDELTLLLPPGPKAERPWRHGNIPLGEWVDNKLEKRLSFVGSNIGAKIEYGRYWRRLIPFLESVVAGKHGHSVELARRFELLLHDLAHLDRGGRTERLDGHRARWIPGWYRALRVLFKEQPEWEGRLHAWIAEVAPGAPPADEPSWRRIRRLRGRSGR